MMPATLEEDGARRSGFSIMLTTLEEEDGALHGCHVARVSRPLDQVLHRPDPRRNV
jgi:hypothetical protein